MKTLYVLTTIMQVETLDNDTAVALAEIGVLGFCPIFNTKKEAEEFRDEVGLGMILEITGDVTQFDSEVS